MINPTGNETSVGIRVLGSRSGESDRILTPEALDFVAELHHAFEPTRQSLLEQRAKRQAAIDAGELPDLLPETADVRAAEWQVAEAPADLNKRWVEITGPTERKMMINALNSGANVFMADFEDALSPTWQNVVEGQLNLYDAVRHTLEFTNAQGKHYRLIDDPATLLVRPRGWHLAEKHVGVGGQSISASLFDFGLYFFHNAHELLARDSGPYFYLAKLENHHEARLWNDVFNFAQDRLGLPRGTIRATVLIETVLAALEMEEILYELREHSAGLNAGRWDYIFSVIKKFANRADFMLPDRAQVTMTVPFMRSYTQLMVKTCHKRGAHAIGGMAAFIPNRRDADVTEVALAKVREDKLRETDDGCDGTWVAHPDLIPTVMEIFDETLGDKPHQREKLREDVEVAGKDIVAIHVSDGHISEAGLRLNVNVALQYVAAWLDGNGAVAINNLMEDTATAEISRAQIWQWIRHAAALEDGRTISTDLYKQIRDEELAALHKSGTGRYSDAAEILDNLVLSDTFIEYLTFPAYQYLD